jgi:hypothetical protein
MRSGIAATLDIDESLDFELHLAKQNLFAESLAALCRQTNLCNGISPSARIFTALCHATKAFKARYSSEPTSQLIADALTNHPSLRSVKNIDILPCKLCSSSSAKASETTHSILNLFTHFQLSHDNRIDLKNDLSAGRALSWFKSMIVLPTRDELEPLITGRNITTTATLQLYQVAAHEFPDSRGTENLGFGTGASNVSPLNASQARARSRSPTRCRAERRDDDKSHYRDRESFPRSTNPRQAYVDDEGYEYVRISDPYVGYLPARRSP